MSDQSAIEWTDATWNPTTGCTKIAPECANCYIDRTPPFRMAGRKFVHGRIPLELHEDRLDKPLHWRKPKRIFVNSLSDLFHEDIPDEFIIKVFAVMLLTQRHTYQVLTKRAERMRRIVAAPNFGECVYDMAWQLSHDWTCGGLIDGVPETSVLPNVWLGTSVGVKRRKDQIAMLHRTPAAVRFLSVEPLLEDLGTLSLNGIHWVIVGGESGDEARPMHPDWARSVRDQCVASGVPFFFKQWGEWVPENRGSKKNPAQGLYRNGRHLVTVADLQAPGETWPRSLIDHDGDFCWITKVGKKAAGRWIDGRTWDEFPAAALMHS